MGRPFFFPREPTETRIPLNYNSVNNILSKTRFAAGLQCHKLLWWTTHEPEAPELAHNHVPAFTLDEYARVLGAARARFPEGVLIDLPLDQVEERVEATRLALARGEPAIFGATFSEDGMVATVDILSVEDRARTLIKVQPTTSIKDHDLWDAGIQAYVLRRAGVDVDAVEIMRLNEACRFPDLSELFTIEAISGRVRGLFPQISKAMAAQTAMLRGPLPDVPVGKHCDQPEECPFKSRCWPALPDHHVETFHGLRREKSAQLSALGLTLVDQVPDSFPLTIIQQRQRRSVTEGKLQVEGDLDAALVPFRGRVAYLAFQTLSPAIPAWEGFGPWAPHPVQFSCHIASPDGGLEHVEWLAEDGVDSRAEMAQALVGALEDVDAVVAYDASFDKKCMDVISAAAPDRAAEMKTITSKLRDLLPVVRNHVYHSEFLGSFDLKPVLSALAPGFNDESLDLSEGQSAEALLHKMLFKGEPTKAAKREALRRNLLDHCAMSSLSLLRLKERLEEVAEAQK